MTNVLILGAAGQIARLAENMLFKQKEMHLTLFVRHPKKLDNLDLDQVNADIVVGDAANYDDVAKVVKGQDIVYANLAGEDTIEQQAANVVKAMDDQGVKRLIWISTLGIYDEVPGQFGEWNNKELDGYLQPYAAAAKKIEDSDLDYTIIRPAWLQDKKEINYETTQKGQEFRGTEVSRLSVASFIFDLINDPTREVGHSVGLNKPHTDGTMPAWLKK